MDWVYGVSLGIVSGFVAGLCAIRFLRWWYSGHSDWTEADDWFDEDEHDLAHLEDQHEE
jgi:hypothetical protein